jgi:Ca2+-binding EF-hand superfamily protein
VGKGKDLAEQAAIQAGEAFRLQKFKETNEQIKDSLADALEKGAKDGSKAMGQSIRDDIERALKNKFRIIVKAVLDPVGRAVTGALGFGSTAATAAEAGNSASSLASLGNLASIGSAVSAIGLAGSMGLQAGLGATFGAGFAGTIAAVEGGMAAIATATAQGMASGFGAIAGALGPYVLAAAALYSVYKSLDKSGTPTRGADVYSAGTTVADPLAGVATTRFGTDAGFQNNRVPEMEKFLAPLALSSAQALNKLAALTGGVKQFAVALQFGTDGVEDTRGAIKLLADGATIAAKEELKFTNDLEQATREFTGELSLSLIDAIKQNITLPKQLADELEQLRLQVGGPTIDAVAAFADKAVAVMTASKQMVETFKLLPGSFSKIANLSDELRIKLADLFGGFQNASVAISSYYEAFYTEPERLAIASNQLADTLKKLGFDTVPKTREAFRDLVDAQDLTTDSGRATYAALIGVSSVFAQITPIANELAQSLDSVVEVASAAADKVLTAVQKINQIKFQRDVEAAKEINRRADEFLSISKSLGEFLNGQKLTSQQKFEEVLNSALRGDTEAFKALPQAAIDAIEAQAEVATSQYELDKVRGKILNDVAAAKAIADLEAQKRVAVPQPEDELAVAMRELATAVRDLGESLPVKLLAAFDKIDLDVSGGITKDEFSKAFSTLATEGTLSSLFNSIDQDGNGVISKLEAINLSVQALNPSIEAVSTGTATDKAAFYNALLKTGLTDSQIRSITEASVGQQTDANWQTLKDIAAGLRMRAEADLSVDATIKLIKDAEGIPGWLQDSLVNGVGSIAVTVNAALASNLDEPTKRVLVEQQGAYKSIITAALSQGLPEDVVRLISQQGGVYNTLVQAALSSSVPDDVRKLVFDRAGGYLATINAMVSEGSSPDALRLALSASNSVMASVNAVLGSNVSQEAKSLALASSDSIFKTVVAELGSVNPTALSIANAVSSSITRTVNAARAAGASQEAIDFAMARSEEITKTVNAVIGVTATQDQLALFLAKGDTITKTIAVNGIGSLTADQSAALNAYSSTVNKAVDIAVNMYGLDSTSKIALQQSSETVSKIIAATVLSGSLSETDYALLRQASETVYKTVSAAVSMSLSPEQRQYLNLVSGGLATSVITLNGNVTFNPNAALESIFNAIKDNTRTFVVGVTALATDTYATADALRQQLQLLTNVTSGTSSFVVRNSTWESSLSSVVTNTKAAADSLAAIANGASRPQVRFDRGSYTGGVYAKGGVFTNTVVTKPTAFPLGLMGEAGEEAIMPLSRGPDGTLGVRNYGSSESSSSNSAEVVAELIRLRVALEGLQGQNSNENYHIIKHTMRVADRLDRWDDGDRMNVNIDNDQPVQVEIAP